MFNNDYAEFLFIVGWTFRQVASSSYVVQGDKYIIFALFVYKDGICIFNYNQNWFLANAIHNLHTVLASNFQAIDNCYSKPISGL